jgi:hypothetical protein
MKQILIAAAALTFAAGSAFAAVPAVNETVPNTTVQSAQANPDGSPSVTAMNNGNFGTMAALQTPNKQYYNYDRGWNTFSDSQAGDGGGN